MKFKIIKKIYEKIYNEKYFPYFIFLISIFVLFFELSGSVGSWDEAIYSQVAKEGILNNNWTSFTYNSVLWFEKPPLPIWLTMIAYKIFGITEFATWVFPAIFGVLGILGIYYIARRLFNSKVALLSSLILLSIPHYVFMSRNNMMDIFLVTNSTIAFLFLLKSKENRKYVMISAVFFGMAFLSKNVIALLYLPIFFYYLYLNKSLIIFRSKYFYYAVTLFFIIILPWHIIMYLTYKEAFLNEYIGYHLVQRYNENILQTYYSSDIFYYFKVLLMRTGSWWFVFLATIFVVLSDVKRKVKDKELKLLIFWMLFIFIFFSSATTKLHHYILPFYIPFSILIAYGIYKSFFNKHIFLLLSTLIIIINIDINTVAKISDLGESRLLVFTIFSKLFNLPDLFIYIISVFLVFYIFYNYITRKKELALKMSLMFVFVFSFVLPFNPDRGILAKQIGEQIKGENINKIYYYDYHSEQNLKNTLIFYNYPIEIEYINLENNSAYDENSAVYCLKSRASYQKIKTIDYDFYPCIIEYK